MKPDADKATYRLDWQEVRHDWPAWLALVGSFVAGILLYPALPERVPIHWNLAGQVDGYGSRAMGAFFLPVMNLSRRPPWPRSSTRPSSTTAPPDASDDERSRPRSRRTQGCFPRRTQRYSVTEAGKWRRPPERHGLDPGPRLGGIHRGSRP
ncbi:DUF1648 domain-containing protein [Geochorda subterranea]|uniref:DUF1648 domain-containing protein n=1 Tax=Geochorda subterranea TaxID=3109564 RepID=UPI003860267E